MPDLTAQPATTALRERPGGHPSPRADWRALRQRGYNPRASNSGLLAGRLARARRYKAARGERMSKCHGQEHATAQEGGERSLPQPKKPAAKAGAKKPAKPPAKPRQAARQGRCQGRRQTSQDRRQARRQARDQSVQQSHSQPVAKAVGRGAAKPTGKSAAQGASQGSRQASRLRLLPSRRQRPLPKAASPLDAALPSLPCPVSRHTAPPGPLGRPTTGKAAAPPPPGCSRRSQPASPSRLASLRRRPPKPTGRRSDHSLGCARRWPRPTPSSPTPGRHKSRPRPERGRAAGHARRAST